MYKELYIESTDTEEENGDNFENPVQDVSLSSIKTQDSIENSTIINVDNEEFKEVDYEFRNIELKEVRGHFIPFLSLKEAQQEVLTALAGARVRLDIKPLHEISKQLHKICEDFQSWRKQD